MKHNQKELMDIMYHNRLKAKDVADMLDCKPNTVRVWRCESGLVMPDVKLQLLKLLMKDKQNEKSNSL